MSRGNDGIEIFRDDQDRKLFLEILGEEVVRCGWVLHDYSLMGNHFHLSIATPECTLSKGMHRFLGRYVQRFNKRHRRRGHLFQDRFKNVIVEQESHALVLTRYIALNPVRAGLCAQPEDWRWSSYAAHAGIAPRPAWLTSSTLLSEFGATPEVAQAAYRSFVLAGLGADDAGVVESPLAGMFLGTATWIDRIQRIIDGTERSEEHPRAQVHPGRPELEDVIAAVAQVFDTNEDEISATHGTVERTLVAWFAFEEALVPLRTIARRLRLTSSGHVSTLIRRCRKELGKDATLRELAETCRARMKRRPPPFLLPDDDPLLRTARRYHRASAERD